MMLTLLIIDGLAIAVVVFIVWWFWLHKPAAATGQGQDSIDIVLANGGFSPARIEIPSGKDIRLRILRRDPDPATGQLVFSQLGITSELALDKQTEVTLNVAEPGEYDFSCQNQTAHGTLVAR